jgi:hypothetical protein
MEIPQNEEITLVLTSTLRKTSRRHRGDYGGQSGKIAQICGGQGLNYTYSYP